MGSGTLSGRTHELAVVDRVLTSRPAALRALAVAGGPGLGKTRLLAELVHRAEAGGWTTVVGTTPEYAAEDEPYGVFTDALGLIATERLTRGDEPDPMRQRLLVPLVPTLSPTRVRPSPQAMHLAVRTLLTELAAPSGVVIVLDDLHWASGASLELIDQLLRHPVAAPVVLAFAYRPRQICRRTAAALDAAVDRGVAEALELGPLSEVDSRALLGPDIPDQVAQRWFTLTGGNPRYLGALARFGPGATPDLSTVLGPELRTLGDLTRVVAHAAAVLGVEFDPALLPEVAEQPVDVIEAELGELQLRDLVQVADAAGRLRFRDQLVHAAVVADAGTIWRRRAHARAGESLRSRGAPVAAYAEHVANSVTLGDEPAIRTLVRAAAASRWRAPADAARYYAAAITALPEERPVRGRRGGLMLAQGEALLRAGDARGARAALADAIALLPRSGYRVRRRGVLAASLAARLTGDYVESAAMLQREIDRDGGEPAPALYAELAIAHLMAGRLADARALVEKVAAMPGTLNLAVQAAIGFVRVFDGATAEAREAANAVGTVVDGLTDAELLTELDAVMWLGWTDGFLGRYDAALRRLCRALSLARSVGQVHPLAYLLTGYGRVLLAQGELNDAAKYARAALDVGRGSGSDELVMMALTLLCQVEIKRGAVEEAVRFGAEAAGYAARARGWFVATAVATYGWARLVAGDPAAAIETILSRTGGPELPYVAWRGRAGWCDILTRAALEVGDEAAAAGWVALAATAAALSPVPTDSVGHAAMAAARLHLARRDPEAAVERSRAARDAFRRAGHRVHEAEAGLLLGRAEALAGDRRRAGDSLRRGERLFADCGAEAGRAEALAQLRRLGLRLPPSATNGTAGSGSAEAPAAALSGRELQVAKLVAEGQTNRQVAGALFLSEKTVERHLSSIFTKLGVTGRAAIATRL
jgi:DNA-binding CsgD family transcriptional regulator/tetratricopeptide (TPR) repeat protein